MRKNLKESSNFKHPKISQTNCNYQTHIRQHCQVPSNNDRDGDTCKTDDGGKLQVKAMMKILFDSPLQSIQATHARVSQSLAEAEIARKSFLQLKEKTKLILGQLKVGKIHLNYFVRSFSSIQEQAMKHHQPTSNSKDLYNPPSAKPCTQSPSAPSLSIPTICPSQATVHSPGQYPLYAQVRKGKTREKLGKRSSMLVSRDFTQTHDLVTYPARNSVASDGDNMMDRREGRLRPRSAVFRKND